MPLRGWTFTSFTLSFFCCILFMCIGYSIQIKSTYLQSLIQIVLPTTIVIALSWSLIKQYNYTSRYANAYDQLITTLINSKTGRIKIVEVKKLPESGMLIPLDISDDYIKNPLKEILDLNYEIKIIK